MPPPFVFFFPLAACDAIVTGSAWVVAIHCHSPLAIAEIADWHKRELLFGFVAAAMAGFLLTALPRWTGRRLDHGSFTTVLASWFAARLVPWLPWAWAPLSALPAVALTLVASWQIWRARNARNVKTVLLLAIYASAGIVCSAPVAPHQRVFATNVAVAAMTGLIILIAGRVLPALTNRFDELDGEPQTPRPRKELERLSAIFAAAGLSWWLLAPDGVLSAVVIAAAGAGQAVRMASWFGRRTWASPPLLALYAAYASIPIGFGFFALHAAAPDIAPADAGFHIWTIGGFGGMILTIMSSMTRKRCNLAFSHSPAAETAAILCLAAGAARVGAGFAAEPQLLLVASALAWLTAFGLFLLAFRAPLFNAAFRRQPKAPRHNRQTEIRP